MTYIIAEPCIDIKDRSRVDELPVDWLEKRVCPQRDVTLP
jgi:hypothetical protein